MFDGYGLNRLTLYLYQTNIIPNWKWDEETFFEIFDRSRVCKEFELTDLETIEDE